MRFPSYRQLNAMDCGPTCLRMIAKYYGKKIDVISIRESAGFGKEGVSFLGLSEAAENIGFKTKGVRVTPHQLTELVSLPCILHWDNYHFIVLIKIKKAFLFRKEDKFVVADPARGIITYPYSDFVKYWSGSVSESNSPTGFALLFYPTPQFFKHKEDGGKKLNWNLLIRYLNLCRRELFQVVIALVITSFLQLIFPFLTQAIVDVGINTADITYIMVIACAQLMLIFSRSTIDFIKSRLLLRVSTIVNLSLLSDFWIKLTKLPLGYFDIHHTGDTLQRLQDSKEIQNFLTGPALSTLLSIFNIVIFAIILASYNLVLFEIFTISSMLYFIWVNLFLKIRRKINYDIFHASAKENNATLQLVQGMQEIRLNNAENRKRFEWENLQANIFKLNFKTLTYNQLQQAGGLFINQGKDVVITLLVSSLVIQNKLSFGAMLAIQYIMGQLSSPVEQIIAFIQNVQDSKISMERLNEIHSLKDEEDDKKSLAKRLPVNKSLRLENLSFVYPGAGNEPVLKNINLEIPEGKITAIVGSSGGGKTTLLKILLKYYHLYEGEIKVNETNFRSISPSYWRSQCGAVMQEGYIFNDTIANNIAVNDDVVNKERLDESCRKSNISELIRSLPNGLNSSLGANGAGLSQGQKQRILIARSFYKDPSYLFLDEATNALDANNERAIVENMQGFFKGKTVIIVAHRLSTVKNADKIVVLEGGTVAEEGNHRQLIQLKGRYFNLIKNQLELDA